MLHIVYANVPYVYDMRVCTIVVLIKLYFSDMSFLRLDCSCVLVLQLASTVCTIRVLLFHVVTLYSAGVLGAVWYLYSNIKLLYVL